MQEINKDELKKFMNDNMVEELAKVMEYLQTHGIEEKSYNVDGKLYNVSVLDIEDFEKICEETIPNFIRRVQPKDDNELSYLMGLHMNEVLKKKSDL